MSINWAALGIVTVVAIVSTLLFVALLSGGIRLVATAHERGRSGAAVQPLRSAGFALLALAAALVLYGIYLIVPLFH